MLRWRWGDARRGLVQVASPPGIILGMTANDFELLEQNRLAELVAAADVQELHRILLLGPQGQMDLDELAGATIMQHHHGDGQPGSVDTALLLCTDRSWRSSTGPLMTWIATSGLLSGDELDELAERFLHPVVVVEIPDSWFGPAIVIDLGPVDPADESPAAEDPAAEDPADEVIDDESGEPAPVRAERFVRPPLRRWATARRLRAQPASFPVLRDLADELDINAGAGVLQGICDALDALPDDVAEAALATALHWPRANVRKLALELLIDRGEHERAYQVASADPDAGIRRWSERTQARLTPGPEVGDDQPSLFDL